MSRYLDPNQAVDRLRREWEQYGGIIIAVDVDSTLLPFHANEVDDDYEPIRNLVRGCKDYGCTIIINTAASPTRIAQIKRNLIDLNIEWDYFNESPPWIKDINYQGKVYANVFLDDRAGMCEVFNALSLLLSERRAIASSRAADLLLQKLS